MAASFPNINARSPTATRSADVQTAAMLNLPRPKLEGAKPAIRNAPATEELKEFVQELAARAERRTNSSRLEYRRSPLRLFRTLKVTRRN